MENSKIIIFVFSTLSALLVLNCCSGIRTKHGPTYTESKVLQYFLNSYDDCRNRFQDLSYDIQERHQNVEVAQILVNSEIDKDLSIDYCYIPASGNKEKLLIISSGVHGMEGFVGSAVQRMFMSEFLDALSLKNMGVLLVHAVNPYGFNSGRLLSKIFNFS